MALCLAQWPQVAPGIRVLGFGGNSYVVVEEILPPVGSQKCRVVLGQDTNTIWDYKARHMASVCDMQQTPFKTHALQKLPWSSPMISHSITLIVQSSFHTP